MFTFTLVVFPINNFCCYHDVPIYKLYISVKPFKYQNDKKCFNWPINNRHMALQKIPHIFPNNPHDDSVVAFIKDCWMGGSHSTGLLENMTATSVYTKFDVSFCCNAPKPQQL